MAKSRVKERKHAEELSMVSLMDIFTVILLFLLQTFSAEGNLLTQAENLKLPFSTSKKTVTEIALTIIVDQNQILVDNQPVFDTPKVAKQDSIVIGPMNKALEALREKEKKAMMAMGKEDEETGRVIVQIDRNLPFDVMYKVMGTCGYSGYGNVAFAIVQKNAE
jgi:biopolymer transport protein ExbD